MSGNGAPLLELEDVHTYYGTIEAIKGISLTVNEGEVVTLIGANGAGKSTTLRSIQGINKPKRGRILFKGEDMVSMTPEELRKFRWRHVSLVFQSAMDSLNPLLRVGDQFVDMLQAHERVRKADALARAGDLLDLVGIDKRRVSAYPHELSGGMC